MAENLANGLEWKDFFVTVQNKYNSKGKMNHFYRTVMLMNLECFGFFTSAYEKNGPGPVCIMWHMLFCYFFFNNVGQYILDSPKSPALLRKSCRGHFSK